MTTHRSLFLITILLLVFCLIPIVSAESVWLEDTEISSSLPGTLIISQQLGGTMPAGCFHTFTLTFPESWIENINNVITVTFYIPDSFLKENGCDVTDIILYGRIERDNEPFWDGKPTTYLDSKNGYAVYESGIPASGDYAISLRKGAAINANVIPTIVYENPQPATPQSPVPVFGLMTGLGLATILLARKH